MKNSQSGFWSLGVKGTSTHPFTEIIVCIYVVAAQTTHAMELTLTVALLKGWWTQGLFRKALLILSVFVTVNLATDHYSLATIHRILT